ncbi:SDR family oxidoreductase [Marinovum sp.]|uniref:SDR family NAD(P)-dependent oxidoreductase n=1 Tax=Marinovum sp. TaxID=2024839 RepID=UPI002B272E1A|nr:SDR family oxidoreductase [Marinovum sp.]
MNDKDTAMITDAGFSGRTALVTGASRGIAAAIAKGLAGQGARVAISYAASADRAAGHEGAADRLVEEIKAAGGEAIAIESDIAQPGAAERLVAECEQRFGAIDTLVLSASAQVNKVFWRQTPSDIATQLQVNLTANVALLQAVLPRMQAEHYGRILTIGSVQEVAPGAEMPIYAMTKAALRNLVENLAVQCARDNVMINNIAPGLIQTDRNAFRRQDRTEWQAFIRSANPAGRAGQPQDVVRPALFLLAPDNTFTTGTTVYVAGAAQVARSSSDAACAASPAMQDAS